MRRHSIASAPYPSATLRRRAILSIQRSEYFLFLFGPLHDQGPHDPSDHVRGDAAPTGQTPMPRRSPFRSFQRLRQIGQNVVDMLQSDRKAYIAWSYASRRLLQFRQLRMGCAGRMDRQAPRIPNVGDVVKQFQRVDKFAPSIGAPANSNPTRPPWPCGRYFAVRSAPIPVW